MKIVLPSILSADFSRLGEQLVALEQSGMTQVHVDVMDGHFVPNITIGPVVCRALANVIPDVAMDVHLMIERPGEFVDAFVTAGASRLTIHAEAEHHLDRVLNRISERGILSGVSINPGTPLNVLENVLPLVDTVLIMSVNPGFGGQAFIPYCLEKIRRLNDVRERKGLSFTIEVDGGVTLENIADIGDSGADLLVAGSAVFRGNYVDNFKILTETLNHMR